VATAEKIEKSSVFLLIIDQLMVVAMEYINYPF